MKFDPEAGPVDPLPGAPARPVDHVGIVVRSIAEAAPLFEGLLGQRASDRESLPEHGVDVCFIGTVELLEPHDPAGPIARFLDRSGSTLHHVAFRVEDVQAELDRLVATGLRPVDPVPRPGAHGCLVAFLHPKTTGGALVELIQRESAP